MAGRLQGKVALVTGGASGIGRAAAVTFAREGAKVMAVDINVAGAEETAASVGRQALAMRLTSAKEADWELAMARTVREFGRLDIVANVAGHRLLWLHRGSRDDAMASDARRQPDGRSAGLQARRAHDPRERRQRCDHQCGRTGGHRWRRRLRGLLRHEGRRHHTHEIGRAALRVTAAAHSLPVVHPTYVDTEMMDPVVANFASRQALLDQLARFVPIGRVATAQDVANAMLFAASEEAAMISGSALLVDGAQLAGWTAIPVEE